MIGFLSEQRAHSSKSSSLKLENSPVAAKNIRIIFRFFIDRISLHNRSSMISGKIDAGFNKQGRHSFSSPGFFSKKANYRVDRGIISRF